jgi:3-hydroxymyristoyl/3-hydroxydecanoyl-(acyl carrier protein) dehydratase
MSRAAADIVIEPTHPALAGHFPGYPLVPGVLLLDEAMHALGRELPSSALWQINVVKFHRPVRPGEPLSLEYQRREAGGVDFQLRSAHGLAVSGTLAARPAIAASGPIPAA